MANTSKIKEIRDEMIKIYGNNCWMGYRLTKNNPFTFHHIFEQRVGGKDLIENGALLTKFAHRDLNTMDLHVKPLYKDLNILFKELNNTKKAPTIDYYKEVNKILVRASKSPKCRGLMLSLWPCRLAAPAASARRTLALPSMITLL